MSAFLHDAVRQGWLSVQHVDLIFDAALATLDRGERAAILLARQFADSLLLIDEKAGRSIAAQLGLQFTGTLGILLRAKEQGLIPALRPELETLLTETGFRITESLVRTVLQGAGEL